MKLFLAILVLTVCVSLDVGAQDIRSKVGPTSDTSFTNIIDPDRSVYGMELGSSEDEFINKFGYPTGYIRLNGTDTVMLYGKEHAFIFTASKLSGVRITYSVFDGYLSQTVLTRTSFDAIKWELSNGVRKDMNLADVKKILGDGLKFARSQTYYFSSNRTRIELDFAYFPQEGQKDESYRIYGIYIRQATSGAAQNRPVSARPIQARIPEATRPCTAEVAKWWQEVRAAAKEVLDAMRRKDEGDIATAKEKYRRLLAEVYVKSYRAPIEDLPPVILYTASPTYTEKARTNKISGIVRMQVELRSDGTIGDVKVVTGLGDGLDEQAIKAIRQIIFLPGVKDGMFVTIMRVLQAEFHLR